MAFDLAILLDRLDGVFLNVAVMMLALLVLSVITKSGTRLFKVCTAAFCVLLFCAAGLTDLTAETDPDGTTLYYGVHGGNSRQITGLNMSKSVDHDATINFVAAEHFDLTDKASLEAELADAADLAEADGDAFTGVHDFGGADSFELPNAAQPTVDAAGEIGLDTSNSGWSTTILKFFGTEKQGVVSMPEGEFGSSIVGGHVVTFDTDDNEFQMQPPPLPLLYKSGFNTNQNIGDTDHDISIHAGAARDSTDTYNLVGAKLTKQIDATWAAGDIAGGLFSGTVTTSTWYYVFVIGDDTDSDGIINTVDYGFDTDDEAANIPAGYDAYRRIGVVKTDGSSNIIDYEQTGHYFDWTSSVKDVASTSGTGGAWTLATTSSPPIGGVMANIWVEVDDTTNGPGAGVTGGDQADPSAWYTGQFTTRVATANSPMSSASAYVATNSSGQVKWSRSNTTVDVDLWTTGWWDFFSN